MTRVAIYARYGSEKQIAASTEAPALHCHENTAGHRLLQKAVPISADEALLGASEVGANPLTGVPTAHHGHGGTA